MEHVSILREPLDWLAGDPKEIEGHAATWRNIEQRIYQATDYFVDEVNRSTAHWTSQAAAAYRGRAKAHAEDVQALSTIADVAAEMTLVAGAMVGVVRNTVRDLIAEVVGAAVSKAVQALLVVTIPKIVADVAVMVAKYSARILNLLKQLLAAIRKLTSVTPKMTSLLDWIGRSLPRAGDNAIVLGAYRTEAAGSALAQSSGAGLSGFRSAYETIGQGNHAVYGGVDQILTDTVQRASRNNAIQNVGATAGSVADDDEGPGPIELPL